MTMGRGVTRALYSDRGLRFLSRAAESAWPRTGRPRSIGVAPGTAIASLPRMTRILALPLLVVAITGCPSSEPLEPGDDAGATGGSGGSAGSGGGSSCTPQSCRNQPVPAIGCANGTAPEFTCMRGNDGQCRWSAPRCPGADASTPQADGGGPGTACRMDSDCRLFDDYCTGCDCRALAKTDSNPTCNGPGVRCAVQPCANKVAACESGRCVVRAATLHWSYTCGDPVCGGWRAKADVRLCSTEKSGDPCATSGDRCDPKDSCNRLLQCSTTDVRPGACPISRRETKRDIRYLGVEELRRYHDELLQMRLATWRYKADPARERLGFIIDDHEQSVAVDAPRDMVDLYSYTSLAVATLQLQAREIADLHARLGKLERRVRTKKR
jgi:hypothetical protein